MYAEERQHEIVTRARELGRVSVAELATRFHVTPETIRRDLYTLSGRGLLSRVHGGAVPAEKLRLAEAPVGARDASSTEEKLAIAHRAIGLLPRREGLTVLLDAGTTTARLCSLLPPWISLAVTNSVPTAAALSSRGDLEVVLLGGEVRGITQATVGADALHTLGRLRVDVAFLGTNGFSVDHGFSTPDPGEAAMKQAMVASAREVYVLADSSKLGVDHLVRFASVDDVDLLVTDGHLPAGGAAELRDAGLRIELA
ncbi:DeoR/GlpR family DNA-binding transcription regulator [Propioniciclava soli]|uniref:DeoR/GlpR family DNA-binding transcription regulator n=1 Tax=Propioniciclava soli TaxID=2775081 RepID=UPI001E418D9D|nr:DeoR/GlpR family DNA-binding transcription regulator [Propioniciclava soli]